MTDQTTALERANQNGIEPQPQKPSGLISRDYSENAILMDTAKFEHCLRVAKLFAHSRLVPEHYRGNLEDCFIATYQATRMRTDVFGWMQNTYVVGGKLAMEGKMAIALINSRGPFAGPLQWEEGGEGLDKYAVAYATHEETGEILRSVPITLRMAEAEGWTKNKKWTSMPEQMLRYRSAAFFGRAYCPDILMGMLTKEEADDLLATGELREEAESRQKADDLTARILQTEAKIQEAPRQLSAKAEPGQEPQAEADAEADAPDVEELIDRMQLEIAQCAECKTQEAAKKCVNGTARRYFDQAQDLSDSDKKRFRKAYDEAHQGVGEMIKQLPSEPGPEPTKAEPEPTRADAKATKAEPQKEQEAPADEPDQPDMFAGGRDDEPDELDDELGSPNLY